MAQSQPDMLTLHRASSGHDLWAAIEAAQYAQVARHVTPRDAEEAAGIKQLMTLFADCAEQWEGKSARDQAVALEQFDPCLKALADLQLGVYWTVIEARCETREGGAVDLPLAVLSIARANLPSITLALEEVTEEP